MFIEFKLKMHKFEEKYQGFENQNNTTLEINIPSFSKSDVPLKYVGNHRIIKRNGLKIVWTLGPHCIKMKF